MNKITKIFFLSLLIYKLQTFYALAQLVPDFRVNDDTTNRSQYNGRIGFDSLGQFTIVWEDYRNNNGNIYCQRFNSNATYFGTNFKINVNPDSSSLPGISVTRNGNFGVCWLEINSHIPNSSKMKFRLFKKDATPLTGEILLNDSSGNFGGIPSVCVNSRNEFTITWNQKGVLYQRIDSIGNKIGKNVLVNDNTVFARQGNPAITVRKDGSFIITWSDTRPPSGGDADDIYFQMFDRFGNRISVNQKVNDDISTFNLQHSPKISSDSIGKFVIGWSDDRLNISHSEVFAQLYEGNGIKNGINFRVTQSSTNFGKGICNVFKKPNGDLLIGWSEFRPNIPKPYFQKYSNTGNIIGSNYLVTNEIPSSEKYYSDFLIFEDKIISVWDDTRNDPFDIYCNIRSFSNPDTTVNIIQSSSSIPVNFTLYQNYPNPFNPSTTITFKIKQKNNYSLNLFNYLGQKVRKLFNKNFIPGTYQFNFEAADLSSGIYYYILSSTKERFVKSFVLLK